MSKMENVVHGYLTKLRIISKIPVNGKMDITKNDLNLYDDSVRNWIWRKYHGDCKHNSVKYLTELFKEINAYSDQLIYNIEIECDDNIKHKKYILLVSITEKIKESLVGIRNLIGTYKDYIKVVSVLECLEQDIIIPQIIILKDFIPEQYHTHIIKSDIAYSHMHYGGKPINSYQDNETPNSTSTDL